MTDSLIRRASRDLDDRAAAAANITVPRDERPGGYLAAGPDVVTFLGRLVAGTNLDPEELEDVVAALTRDTLDAITAHPAPMLPTILAGWLRKALLVGHRTRELELEEARRHA